MLQKRVSRSCDQGLQDTHKVHTDIQILDEHCHLVYQVDNPALDKAVHKLKSLLTIDPSEDMLVSKTRNNRIERTRLENEAIQKTVRCAINTKSNLLKCGQIDAVLKVANDPKTHWRYAMMAVRILRSLFRRDRPIGSDHLQLFLEKLCDSDPNIVSLSYFPEIWLAQPIYSSAM